MRHIPPPADWTSDGCDTGFVSDDGIVNCSCNHLTNFACLVVSSDRDESWEMGKDWSDYIRNFIGH